MKSVNRKPAESIPETQEELADSGEAEGEWLSAAIPPEHQGWRLDQSLAELFPDYSRNRLQQWIREQRVVVDGGTRRPRDKVRGGEWVEIQAVIEDRCAFLPEPIKLKLIHADPDLFILDKPAGLVVHPAAGNWQGTLLNALLYQDPDLARLPRGGIVHRLDKETSGLMVVARSLKAHGFLVEELQARRVQREYLAIVVGLPTAGGQIEAPIGRHPRLRTRMAVVEAGRPALTHYRVLERYRGHSLLQVRLETGRTHQIRVHMAHIGLPLLGDPVYGGRLRLPAQATPALVQTLRRFQRQALHAWRLELTHPSSGERLSWQAEMPPDMADLRQQLRLDLEAGE